MSDAAGAKALDLGRLAVSKAFARESRERGASGAKAPTTKHRPSAGNARKNRKRLHADVIGHCVLIKPALIGSHLGWGTIAVPGDEPGFVVVTGELDERGSQLFDGIEGSHPQ